MNRLMRVTGGLIERGGQLVRADLLVEDGVIAALGRVPPIPDAEDLSARDCVVVPGFVNAHAHSGENFNPGLYENLPLDLWFLHSHQVLRDRPADRDEIYIRTLLGAIQMLRAGTTAVGDFLFEAPSISPATVEPVLAAYRDVGLRVVLLMGVSDKPYLESLPWPGGLVPKGFAAEPAPPDTQDILDIANEVIQRWHTPRGMVQVGLGPSAPQRCTERLLLETLRLAEDRDLVWHTHVLETKSQASTGLNWYGKSFVEHLFQLKLLGSRTSLIHGVWLTHADVDLIAATGTSMVHCPVSNLRLGDGVSPIPALVRAGVSVGLGTDGRGCDEQLDVLALARQTALLHKVWGSPYQEWIPGKLALGMASEAGARCLGLSDQVNGLQVGANADFVLVDLSSITFTPLNDFHRQLVYGGRPGDLRAVVIDGRRVVDAGRIVTIDEQSLLREVRDRFSSPKSTKGSSGLGEIESQVAALWRDCEDAPLNVHSYIGPLPRPG
jgi:5-methylthioadenosine/S-adenosylhomocysteine deaminase